jgi:predicted nucleic acid-binding protein
MRLYLDNCCFNRPFDNQEQLKIKLETEAKLFIQQESLYTSGIKVKDALHISCAVYSSADCFITTDKKLLNTKIPEIQIINPIIFINEEG